MVAKSAAVRILGVLLKSIQDIPIILLPPPSATATIKSLSQKHPLTFAGEQLSPITESTLSIAQHTSTSTLSTHFLKTPAFSDSVGYSSSQYSHLPSTHL